jgi:glucan phosphoethanolaminetransferase (alkaline phosphatase superfamily)
MPKGAEIRRGKNDYRIIYVLLATQFAIPFISIALLQQRFGFALHTIYYHMLLVGAANLAWLVGALLVCWTLSSRIRTFAHYLLCLFLGGFSVLLFFTHLLAWGGEMKFGYYISFNMLIPFLTHLGSTVETLPVPSLVVWTILVIIPAAILIFYAAMAPSLFAFLQRSIASLHENKRELIIRLSDPRYRALAACLVLAAAYTNHRWPVRKELMDKEPLTAILHPKDVVTPLAPISGLGSEDDAVRRDYVCPEHFQRKNVILIIVDALRPDHLGFTGYGRNTSPFLDNLYRQGNLQLVRSSFAAVPWSFGGILSILRSKHWFNMGVRSFALQDLLKDAGYRIHFILSADHTYFCRLKSFYGDSIDSFCDGTSFRSFGPTDDRGVFEAFDRIQKFDGVPAFFYFHLMSVHEMGPRLPQNVRFTPASVRGRLVEYSNNYDNGVVQADRNIQDLFDRLQKKGYLQNSIVVLTADHGQSLGERNCFGHGKNLYNEELAIPIMFCDSESTVYRNLTIGRQIDIAPTILDRLGLPIPSSWNGRSLFSREPERYSYHQIGHSYAVIDYTTTRILKYIYNTDSKTQEIYDLAKDPHEMNNLFPTTDEQEIGALRQAISAFPIQPAR